MTVSISRPDLGRASLQLSRSRRMRALVAGAASAAAIGVGALAIAVPPATAMQATASRSETGGMEGHEGGARHRARARAHVQRMLTEVNATPEQRSKIETIMNHAFDQTGQLHQKMREGQRELHRLLGQPTIDRNALERVRAQRIHDLDESSKIMVKALADAAEVLTPQQRAKVAQLEEARSNARRERRRP
jgi:Spy/CpxP family protein refolding chaperone